MTDGELDIVFDSVSARIVKKPAGKIIAAPTDVPTELCIVVVMYRVKSDGKKEVVSSIIDGAMFGLEAAVSGNGLGVYAASARDTELLYITVESLLQIGKKASESEAAVKLYSNLTAYLCEKVLRLESNTGYITTKGMRKKIAKLIYEKYAEQQSFDVKLGIDRNQMAKFLNVSRPSMSREMIRMREEGIIEFRKDAIHIKDIEKLKAILGNGAEN